MRQVRKTAACILAVIVMAPGLAAAAPDTYDIDLKDLRYGGARQEPKPAEPQPQPQPASPVTGELDLKELRRIAPPHTAQRPRRPHQSTAAAPHTDETVMSGQESMYVVKPGDHLFRILMVQYGLSDPAAERLIPEISRLNNLANPKALTPGQRLRIPLPDRAVSSAAPRPAAAAPRQEYVVATPLPEPEHAMTAVPTPTPPPEPAQAQEPTPVPEPVPVSAAAPAQTPVPASSPEYAKPSAVIDSISLIAAPPCELARSLTTMMGLLVPSHIEGEGISRAAYNGRSVTVACGLSRAEQYTYGRLLNHGTGRLLAFDGSESPRNVVEQLAIALGLQYEQHNPDSTTLPLTYTFAPFGTRSREVQITILPDLSPLPPPKPPESRQ